VQRQLHSVLATMAKLSGWGILDGTARRNVCNAAACAVSDLLMRDAERQHEQEPVGTGSSSSSSHAAAMVMLPSAVILGNYTPPQQGTMSAAAATLSAVQFSLQTGTTRKQLVAAGYASVLQQLEQLEQLASLQVAQELQSTGLALCSFAVPCMCNNPGCMSMAGLSELAAVSRRSCICAGCRVARYCGRACQRAAWKQARLWGAQRGCCCCQHTASSSSCRNCNGVSNCTPAICAFVRQ
jgi:hypothetical protein